MTMDASRDRLIDLGECLRITGLSRSVLYERLKDGEFTPVKLGRALRFSANECHAFVQQQLEAARQSASA